VTIVALQAIRQDSAYAEVFDHVRAIYDRPDTINVIACVFEPAIVGQSYLPPDRYVALRISLVPTKQILLARKRIDVRTPPDYQSTYLLSIDFQIEEHQTTRLEILFKLEDSLLRKGDRFEFDPKLEVQPL